MNDIVTVQVVYSPNLAEIGTTKEMPRYEASVLVREGRVRYTDAAAPPVPPVPGPEPVPAPQPQPGPSPQPTPPGPTPPGPGPVPGHPRDDGHVHGTGVRDPAVVAAGDGQALDPGWVSRP